MPRSDDPCSHRRTRSGLSGAPRRREWSRWVSTRRGMRKGSARPALAWGRAPRLRTPRARPESLHLTCADRRSWSTRAAQSAANIHARGSSEAAEPFYSTPIPTPRPSRPRGAARAAPYPFVLRPASTAAACGSRSAVGGPWRRGGARERPARGGSVASGPRTERLQAEAARGGDRAARDGPGQHGPIHWCVLRGLCGSPCW